MPENSSTPDETVEAEVVEAPEVEDESTDDDVDLEDIEVSLEEVEDESKETESEKESDEEDTEGDEQTEESEDSEEEVAQPSDEDKQKQHNREMAERRLQEKQLREMTQKEQQDAYVSQATDEKDLALRQLQVDAYTNKVDRASNSLTTAYERAVKDFDVLRDASPEIRAEVDDAIDSFQARYVTVDALGNPTEVRADLYNFLKAKADSIGQLTSIGARKQGIKKANEKSKTFTPPSKKAKQPKADPDLAAFDEEANK